MSYLVTRRKFLAGLTTAAGCAAAPTGLLARAFEPPLYPPTDLSYFDRTIAPAGFEMRFAYHAITWKGDDMQAIKDISSLGFRGIQLRANVVTEYGDKPGALRDLLKQHNLEFVALSSGGPGIAPGTENDEIARHVKHATFLRDAGGHYLQLTDSARPKDRKPVAADYKKLGKLLTEIGKRSVDLGIPVAYHNHMNDLGEAPEEVDWILDAADPRYVKLLLDVAHYTQGGGDPVQAVRKYRDRIVLLHIKDVESPVPGGAPKSYRFVELGRGKVNLPGVFAALQEIKYRGWGVIELDSVPDDARTPKESAIISKKYVEEKLKLKV
ncbi:MAG TPA: sugar phosphate isomerase/epimerase [Blastocatellia bacterium]|nr:sugar phosphate isomerase/epimerase [Blastocatellia bacterium]